MRVSYVLTKDTNNNFMNVMSTESYFYIYSPGLFLSLDIVLQLDLLSLTIFIHIKFTF